MTDLSPSERSEARILAHVTRERRFIYLSFVGIWIALVGLQYLLYANVSDLRETQKMRCMERNRIEQVIIGYLPDDVNKQAVLDEAGLPADCDVYDDADLVP